MRVISGSARGKRLGELSGMETRPTTDRVKEALFNIVQFELPGRQILDLFGGTGQLGIEALSRGAAGCTFVDMRGGRGAPHPPQSGRHQPGRQGPGGPGGLPGISGPVRGKIRRDLPRSALQQRAFGGGYGAHRCI